MASSIQILRSTTAKERPFPGSLLEGQPAVNVNSIEPGLFFKASDGSLLKIGPAAITSDGNPPNTGGVGQQGNCVGELWLDKALDPPVLKVFDGSDWIDAGSGGGGGGSGAFVRWIYTASGGETSLSGTSNGVLLQYQPGLEEVFINGVLITRGVDYVATTGSSITGLQPLTSGDVVTVLSDIPLETVYLPGQASLLRWFKLATAGQTVISGADSSGQSLAYTAGFEEVFINGVLLNRGVDYTATNGTSITLTDALSLDDEIAILAFSAFDVGSITNANVSVDAEIESSKLLFTASGSGAESRSVESKLRDIVSVADFGAIGDGATDVTPFIDAAWLTHDVVGLPEPDISWRMSTTLVVPSGKKLVSLTSGYVPVSGTAAFLIDMTNTVDAEISGLDIEGPDSGTSYQIRLSSANYNTVDVKIKNGNSGISLTNSSFNKIKIACLNMRGTVIKISGTSTQNDISEVEAVNVAAFGALVELGASKNRFGSIRKFLDAPSVNSTLATLEASNLAQGRIGLEALGVRVDGTDNTFDSVHAFDAGDNGVSITGSGNSLGVVHARNCDNDGLHIYGSYNSVGSLVSEANEQSGLGISQSATTGQAQYNVVGAAVLANNDEYGLRIVDGSVTAKGNYVTATSTGNTLGTVSSDTNFLDNHIALAQSTFNINVKDFGAVGDGVANDTVAIQNAVDYLKSVTDTVSATLLFPAGKYKITSPIDFSASGGERMEIVGGFGTLEVATIIVGYHGYGASSTDKGAFYFAGSPSGSYSREFAVSGFLFERASASFRTPPAIEAIGAAQSRINNVTTGSWSNTCYRFDSPQNCRCYNLTSFSGGKSFEYKNTTGITVTQTGTTLTASGAIFSSADVGKWVAIWGTGSSTYRRKTQIVTYSSPTSVTVSTNVTDATPRTLLYGSPFATLTSGSAVVTADAGTFSTNDVGLRVWFRYESGGELFRSKIISRTSSTTVTLADPAPASTTTAEFGCAALEVYTSGDLTGSSSDNKFVNLQVENHAGVGICLDDTSVLEMIPTKVHSEQDATAARYSLSPMWVKQADGFFSGSFDAQYIGAYRFWITKQTSSFTLSDLTSRTALDEKIFGIGPKSASFDGGVLILDNISINGGRPDDGIKDVVVDQNVSTPGYVITGTFANQGDSSNYVITGHLNQNVYVSGDSPELNLGTSRIISGSGNPEGSVVAPVGSLFLRTDGGVGTTLYVKETGTGNTGWSAK